MPSISSANTGDNLPTGDADPDISGGTVEITSLRQQLDDLLAINRRLVLDRDEARLEASRVDERYRGSPLALPSELEAIYQSTSWRITRPLRSAGDYAKRFRRRRR